MVSAKRLLQMARKWRKMAALGRPRILLSRPAQETTAPLRSNPSCYAPSKGTFVVYSLDGGRFVVPLAYLNTPVFLELLEMSEEEFGLPRDGPIVMPCDAALMAQVIAALGERAPREAVKALLGTIAGAPCTSSFSPQGVAHRPLLIPGF
ncbi:unnamed protein product [Spirodela intermedia]|uniref:Uncharacterized protein n=1 Tax=Spirodela intermedia TaxID=51605 RepID=A0A7I8IZ48_SPIIN|nr:unnamed protein product [Spirodela intermedia]CAA6663256.1 unnamed protein product [Spirodela intermedia]